MMTRMFRVTSVAIAAVGLLVAFSSSLSAQIISQPAGVEVDAQGVLKTRIFKDPTGKLTKLRVEAAKGVLDQELQATTELRMISLQRLNESIAERIEKNLPLTDEQKYMAGLTSISHVFYYPTTKDIVIAGPAEGFYQDLSGRVVGMDSGKPVLHLEDFCVALRAYPPTGSKTGVIACSIDPTKEGLQRFQQVYSSFNGRKTASDAVVMNAFREALGHQTITIKGVSPKTRFAQVLVEADYRMKLIGIGLERPAVKFKSFAEAASPRQANQMQRWYFVPDYDTIQVSEDELAMSLTGQGAKLVGVDELVKRDGTRVSSAKVNRASKGFTTNFTKRFGKLAEKTPVFAELKNMIDMAIVAAYIQEMDYYGKAGWDMGVLGDESKIQTEIHNEPKHVAPAINSVQKGSATMYPIGGGVNIQARKALTVDHMKYDESGQVEQARNQVNIDNVDAKNWWWD